ncbi:SAV_2336 N-terminal domain-related protein [Amycolatopsis sp. NPDC004169]|uniref:SAV_2336 N-terminal domain-related protein n=1 Tax=Amycolatopsis sp. NPDC004169 TaxID=3154453 RepID=UPI0033BE723A
MTELPEHRAGGPSHPDSPPDWWIYRGTGRPLLVTGRSGSGKSSLAYRISRELGLGRVLRCASAEARGQAPICEFVVPELVRDARRSTSAEVFTANPSYNAEVRDDRVWAAAFPMVMTANNGEREFPPAFLRSCLQLETHEPDASQLAAMVAAHTLDPEGGRARMMKTSSLAVRPSVTCPRTNCSTRSSRPSQVPTVRRMERGRSSSVRSGGTSPGRCHEMPKRPNLTAGPPRPNLDRIGRQPAARDGHRRTPCRRFTSDALPGTNGLLPNYRRDDVELDEDRTAEEASQTGMWLPVTRRRRGRWLDLTLVVDSSPSMALWTATVNAFARLLERLGAFRSVRVRLLETGKTGTAEGGEVLGPTLRGGTADAPARGAGEVIGAADRSILLLMTDGVSDAWHRDLVSPLLARWARAMPVAIVHLLPQRLWPRGGMAIHRAVLTPPGPLRPNGTYDVRSADLLLNPAEATELTDGAIAVPVLELQDRWLGWWASMITGVGDIARKAAVVLARDQPRPGDHAAGPEPERSAREKVKRFHSSASPSAFRLATLLAAVPVDVGVARTLQAEPLPGSGPDHLAEVFTSGLLERVRDGTPWDRANWEFSDHVKQLLLRGARRSDTAHAVISASRRFGDQNPVLARLQAALAAPDATPDPAAPAATKAEIALKRDLMRALSRPYLSRADRLESRIATIGQHGVDPPTTIPAVSETKSQELKPASSSKQPASAAQPDAGTGKTSPPQDHEVSAAVAWNVSFDQLSHSNPVVPPTAAGLRVLRPRGGVTELVRWHQRANGVARTRRDPARPDQTEPGDPGHQPLQAREDRPPNLPDSPAPARPADPAQPHAVAAPQGNVARRTPAACQLRPEGSGVAPAVAALPRVAAAHLRRRADRARGPNSALNHFIHATNTQSASFGLVKLPSHYGAFELMTHYHLLICDKSARYVAPISPAPTTEH